MTSDLLCVLSESFYCEQANSPELLASPVSVSAGLSCADQIVGSFFWEIVL